MIAEQKEESAKAEEDENVQNIQKNIKEVQTATDDDVLMRAFVCLFFV